MKSSLGKLRKFSLLPHPKGEKEKEKDKPDHPSTTLANELTQASLDMQDMRDCYDSLLSAAAATANSAYEFSESLKDMGTCLQGKTVLNDDEQSCKVLSMLGNVQFELQKLVDAYRSHVNLTITTPSESLLNELLTVEEMKRQCDEKRSMYDHMVAQQREKGRSKSGKMEVFSSQQLKAACDEYIEEATLCIFRLKSLKQGQCRSLVTQAARHYASQLNFFRKGLRSLEAVEPHIRLIAEKHHIDFGLTELDEGEDDGVNSFESNGDREPSFDLRTNKQGREALLTSKNSMEVMNEVRRRSSYSAPIFPEKKFDPSERVRDMQQPSTARKSYSYVLPTPDDAKGVLSSRTNNISASQAKPVKQSRSSQNLAHLSQIEPETYEIAFTSSNSKVQLKKDLSSNNLHVQLPQTSAQGTSHPHFDANSVYDTSKVKRHAFSGPIISKSSMNKPALSTSGSITPTELPQLVSGLLSRVPTYQASFSSPKVSPTASPPIVSSPRINELHQLPRPPDSLVSKAVASSSSGQSGPIGFRNQEISPRNRGSGGAFSAASPLPTPPLSVSRSFSIPSSSRRSATSQVTKLLEPSRHLAMSEEVNSPPLTPISISKIKLSPNVSEMAPDSRPTKGGV